MGHTEVTAMNEIYEAGKGDAEQLFTEIENIREAERAAGFLDKMRIDTAYNRMLLFLKLYQVKNAKLYRYVGLNWADFCSKQGLASRTVDETLADLRPLLENFSADFAEIFQMPFNKIRYLGKTISADSAEIAGNEIVVGEERIELKPENRDAIETLIDEIKESHKREIEARKSELAAKEDQISAQRKLADAKQTRINMLEKELARKDRETAKGKTSASPDEDEYVEKIDRFRTTFDGIMATINPENPDALPESATPRMRAAYVATLKYVRELAQAYWDSGSIYAAPDDADGWQQPESHLGLVDDLED